MSAFSGLGAIAGLTITESMRQRLWLLLLAAIAGICYTVPSLKAVDDAARLKLSVSVITGVIGFITVILAILISATMVRRDLDARVSFMLFSKPLRRMEYLAGRWLGIQLMLAVIVVILAAMGTVAVGLKLGRLPRMYAVESSVAWESMDQLGKQRPIEERQTKVLLSGAAGNGLVFAFDHLPPPAGPDYDLLLRFQVRGQHVGDVVSHARLKVFARDGAGERRRLELHPDSPYGGRLGNNQPVSVGEVVVRDRSASGSDLSQDYLHLVLPAAYVQHGAVTVTVTRLDDFAILHADRGSCYVVSRSGSFLVNLLRAGVVALAQTGILCAVALCIAALSNVGVALFAGLTYYFAGNTISIIAETLRWERQMSPAFRRMLEALTWVAPDLQAFPVEAKLAASQAVTWDLVGHAWLYYGAYTAVFFALAWIVLRRREL